MDKKWAGLAKEVFTTADHYATEILRPSPDPLRVLTVAAAMTIDMMYYEVKDLPG